MGFGGGDDRQPCNVPLIRSSRCEPDVRTVLIRCPHVSNCILRISPEEDATVAASSSPACVSVRVVGRHMCVCVLVCMLCVACMCVRVHVHVCICAMRTCKIVRLQRQTRWLDTLPEWLVDGGELWFRIVCMYASCYSRLGFVRS